MGGLIPGLPDDLVLEDVVPRLPWHVLPVCRSISKSWKARIDVHDPVLEQKTREFQLPLLRGTFLILTLGAEGLIIIQDEVNPSVWHRLPPLPHPISGSDRIMAWSGLVYVCFYAVLFKLDLCQGICKWKRFPVSIDDSWANAFAYKGIIYKTRGDGQTHVYDMTTNRSEQIKKWDCRNVGVIQRPEEEIYGFYNELYQPVKLMLYDPEENSWRMRSEVPMLDSRRRTKYMVVNGDCFEPAVLEGFNIVTDVYTPKLQWYNSSRGDSWTAIDHRSMVPGRIYMVWVDHGLLLCVSYEEGRGFILWRGTIYVTRKRVVWYQVYGRASNFLATIMT